MSHITTIQTKVKLTSAKHIKNALTAMKNLPVITLGKTENQLTFTETGDVIRVHHKATESFQTQGNVKFTKEKTGEYKMTGDRYSCGKAFDDLKDQFLMQYQMSELKEITMMRGMTPSNVTTDKEGHLVMTATRY